MEINDFIVKKDFILDIHNNTVYNKIIIEYYKQLHNEYSHPNIKNIYNLSKSRVERITTCNKYWEIDIYQYHQIKDFISTRLCKDKFCNNCKKVKQASRMSKYITEMEPYKNSMYHLTLTIPNCKPEDLKRLTRKLSKSFQSLIRFISSRKKINGIDFSQYGYLGAVRSLEITFKQDSYHPHYHVALVFENLELDKTIENKYSIDNFGIREKRLFSEFEILIQKIWYLIINNITVTKNEIENLEIGYSCTIDKFSDDNYAELFKYMIKETDETNNVLTYNNFKTLYLSTHYLKQIQGYGCLYRIQDIDLEEEIEKIYISVLELLKTKETPISGVLETPHSLLNDNNYKLISRKKIYQYLKNKDNN